jgi:adenosine deaminase
MKMSHLTEDMRMFIEGLPKAELHVHLEGSIPLPTVLMLAERNKMDYPWKTIEEIREALDNRSVGLKSFLDTHYMISNVVKTRADFYDITYDFLRICKQNNVIYVEAKFDPQFLLEKGATFEELITGIDEGRKEGFRDFGVECNLIMCINRDRTVESAWEMIEYAYPYRHLIKGLGLDSYEKDNPPSKFKEVYEKARQQGYRVTAHCDVDQDDSIKHMWECIDILKTDRIDHGVNSIESPELVQELIKRNITLTACPTWRSPYTEPRDLPRIRKMYDMGLNVTLNSDDPGEFNSGYMNKLLMGAVEGSGYTKEDLIQFMRNAYNGAWLPQEKKDRYLEKLEKYAASY